MPAINTPEKQLEHLRKQLHSQDRELLLVLKKRMQLASKIGTLKAKNDWDIAQNEYWEKTVEARSKLAQKLGLNEVLVKQLFLKIHSESKKAQQEIITNRKK